MENISVTKFKKTFLKKTPNKFFRKNFFWKFSKWILPEIKISNKIFEKKFQKINSKKIFDTKFSKNISSKEVWKAKIFKHFPQKKFYKEIFWKTISIKKFNKNF